METPLSGAANGLAQLVLQKWFSVMGILGLLLFVTTFIVDTPGDVVIARCVALIMGGWGLGLTECRSLVPQYEGRRKYYVTHWQLTRAGLMLFAIATCATIVLAIWLARISLL